MWYPRSIRWRLQLWHGCLLMVVTVLMSLAYHRSERREAEARLDRDLRLVLMVALPELGMVPPAGGGGRAPAGVVDGRVPPRHALLQEWVATGGFVVGWNRWSDRLELGVPPEGIATDWAGEPDLAAEVGRNQAGQRILWHVRRSGEIIGIGRPLAELDAASARLAWRLAGFAAVVVVGGWLAGAWLIGRALRPLAAITATARRIADGAFSERIPTAGQRDELEAVAGVLNASFARVEESFRQQAQFTADASHELRTPISVILSESQLALSRERSAESYRDSLAVCLDAARRMKGLVDDLLGLARAEAAGLAARREPVDWPTLVGQVGSFLAGFAAERGVTLQIEAVAATSHGDPEQLERVVLNLVMNAIQHAPAGSCVEIGVSTDSAGAVEVAVSDSGPGLAAAEIERVFDRFHRVDAARSRQDGGAGLGLAIARAVAEAHGGSLRAESVPGVRTTFTLHLPPCSIP